MHECKHDLWFPASARSNPDRPRRACPAIFAAGAIADVARVNHGMFNIPRHHLGGPHMANSQKLSIECDICVETGGVTAEEVDHLWRKLVTPQGPTSEI